MDWSHSALVFIRCVNLLAQASPTPQPSPTPRAVDSATIEFLKGQFQSLTTTFNIYVALLSSVAAIFIAFAACFFKRTLSEAKQEVQQLVRDAVKYEIAETIKKRVSALEQILEREEVPAAINVDYVLQVASGSLPPEYRLLHARFPRIKPRKLDSRKFNGDVVVLDLVRYQPKISPSPEGEAELALTQFALQKMWFIQLEIAVNCYHDCFSRTCYLTIALEPSHQIHSLRDR